MSYHCIRSQRMPSEDRGRTEYYYACAVCGNSEIYLVSLSTRTRVTLRRSDLGWPELLELPAGLVIEGCDSVPQSALCPGCKNESLGLVSVATIC